MKKQFMLIGIFVILFGAGFSGCTEQKIPPNIQIEKEGGWLRVISVDRAVDWTEMNITISAGNYSYIQFSQAPLISKTYSYQNGATCPDTWQSITPGNAIHFLYFTENITVQLKWVPTHKIIGEWRFP